MVWPFTPYPPTHARPSLVAAYPLPPYPSPPTTKVLIHVKFSASVASPEILGVAEWQATTHSQKTMLNATPPLIVLIAASTYRSCCGGTLAQRLEQLEDSLAPHMLAASEGRPPPLSDLRGDEADVSKLLALRAVAMHIKAKGSMLYSEAATLACARRASFFSTRPRGSSRAAAASHRQRGRRRGRRW